MSEIVDNNEEFNDNNVIDSADDVIINNQSMTDDVDINDNNGKHSDYKVTDGKGADVYHLSGMFRTWFLEYA